MRIQPLSTSLSFKSSIAQHLEKEDLLRCSLVCRSWHEFLRPRHWQSTVFDAKGPFFPEWRAENLVDDIQSLDYHIGAYQGPMPTQGYDHLTTLKFVRGHDFDPAEHWHPLAQLVRASGSLASLTLINVQCGLEFWEAMLLCPQLKSLSLCDVTVPLDTAPGFWKGCRSIESLNSTYAYHHTRPIYLRLFKLKNLSIKDLITEDKDAKSTQGRHWLCSPNLESLDYTVVSTRTSEVEVVMMVQDIKEAIVAAAEGRNHYEQDQDISDENVEQYRGLIPGKKLHTINLPTGGVKDEDLDFLINNADALQSLSGRIILSDTILESVMLHCNTLVKVDICCGAYVTLLLLKRCPLLQELVAGRMEILQLSRSRSWACAGLRTLKMHFEGTLSLEFALAQTPSSLIFEKLSQLRQLQVLDMTPRHGLVVNRAGKSPFFGLACGMGSLAELKELRAIDGNFSELDAKSAQWMVDTWPKLEKVVHFQRNETESLADEVLKILRKGRVNVMYRVGNK